MAEGNVNPMPCVDNQRDTITRAEQIFRQRCLSEFFVASVVAQKYPGAVPCRWRVTYKYLDPNRQYEGGEYAKRLVRRFDAVKPECTNIMKPAIGLETVINDGPRYVMHYGVICECVFDEVPYFGSNDDGPIHISEILSY